MLLPKHRLGVLIVDLLDPSTQPFHIKQAAMSVVDRSAPLLREGFPLSAGLLVDGS